MRESPRTVRKFMKIKSVGAPEAGAQNLPSNLDLHGKQIQSSPKHVYIDPISKRIFRSSFGPGKKKHRPSVTGRILKIKSVGAPDAGALNRSESYENRTIRGA